MSNSSPFAASIFDERQEWAERPTAQGVVTDSPKAILRLEGAAVLAAASAAYWEVGSGWTLFAILFLVPDVSMLGYLIGRRIGAVI